MSVPTPDELHRTLKLELDEGRAASYEDAEALVAEYILQLVVGDDIFESPTRQAILLTSVNAARRAFLGGVRVLAPDGPLTTPWAEGATLHDAVTRYGATLVQELDERYPTIVIGNPAPKSVVGDATLHPTWQGWSAGVVESATGRLPETDEFALAGVLAAALGVSEAFQRTRGSKTAARRDVGASLWNPECDWRDPAAFGPPCELLPQSLWLLGLGHLGQAYCWAIGFLPYETAADATVVLQDYDRLVPANWSTGLLADPHTQGYKTRIASTRLEGLGFNTRIIERAFDEHTKRRTHEPASEPAIALAGFHSPGPRRLLGGAGFDLVVDAGLGAGRDYLDILIHAFPSSLEPRDAFPQHAPRAPKITPPAYSKMIEDLRDSNTEEQARCGVIEIAGRTAGAAFVGVAAAAFVLAEVLRPLNAGPRYEVLSIPLRDVQHLAAAEYQESSPINPGFLPAASPKGEST